MNPLDARASRTTEKGLLTAAEEALALWGLQGTLSLIKHRENAVFALRTDSGDRFALRIHRAGYHCDEALQSELQWMMALAEAGISVPTVVPTPCGKFFAILDSSALPDARQVDLLAWVEGEQIGTIEEPLEDNPERVRYCYSSLGQLAARLHNHSAQWTLPENFKRHHWDKDGLVGKQPFWGQFWELKRLTDDERGWILQAKDRIAAELGALEKTAECYGMVHADFVPENALLHGEHLQLIDFDDSGFSWYLFELATALYFIQEDKHYELAKRSLIEGYRQHRTLSEEALEKLPLFLAARSLTYLGWAHTREGNPTADEMQEELIERCMKTIKAFLAQ
ncbi:phosphotransferase enzyme family protein [Pseudoteredinibacter isoporae]|uniref:Ser/Thr protein kinase RdoA (MazF antagonist) n=1 Tax=Pseudoteredinibacter isoporae TaxID=570281 RepID=A0A7X0JPQ6_9GAMM|nr:phosphotransferase [Pseudoteredinibacter isoporae]MBB6520033.1 Ser/Thr protein kinase RdoA (MazF antagonist) [Pseudoteredinibacter isoporae]NHO85605.1 phosphotransferase [Pseudoteredinibacter isoporae]NIB25943.1 phosphotransferase [Pseudoteredinibacter isoporae]